MSAKEGASRNWRWVGISAAFLAWPVVYFGALFVVGALADRKLTSFNVQQGYWTYIGLMSTVVVPSGWVVSTIIYVFWRRLWFVLALPCAIGATMALVPVVLGFV